MKVKLLKKVRRRFEILHYPNIGFDNYILVDNFPRTVCLFYRAGVSYKYNTLYEAKEGLLLLFRWLYGSYTRKYKISNINNKVWYK